MKNEDAIDLLEAELARQDEELARVTQQFNELVGNARVQVPQSFFEELEEACRPRPAVPTQFVFGLRG
jgi:hypothetical protein